MHDIHIHVIPGVDDGSWSLEMSWSMLRMAYIQGIRKMIATPHSSAFDEEPELVESAFGELKDLVARRMPELKLYPGCEVYCRKDKMKTILELLETGIYPSMNHTNYVLTEFSTRIEAEEALRCTGELQNAGWIPILAHVERYKNLFADEKILAELKEKGCLMQMNAYSVFDEGDETIKQNARRLAELGLADFLGTDAHRMNHRPPDAENGLNYLYSNFEKEYIDRISFGNAEKLLALI